MAKKTGLGKGLGAILSDATLESGSNAMITELETKEIEPNPNQPRTNFDEDALADLADSIKKEGLLQPILVRPVGNTYQIIAGERRWQASQLAGLKKVPVRVLKMDDIQTMRVALIENLQRTDLNAIEEARGYKELMRVGGLTQAQLAESVSKSRSAVANSMRLLDLPEEIQEMIYANKLTAGHARALLSIPEKEKRIQLAEKVAKDQLSVRETENTAKLYAASGIEKPKRVPSPKAYKVVARELRKQLDTQVKIKTSRGKNRIEIEFEDEEDLQRIFKLIQESEEQ